VRHNGSMVNQEVILVIEDERSSDSELLEASVLALREEILSIVGIQDGPIRSTAPPPHSKGGVAGLLGTLIITVPASMPILRELRTILRDWLHRNDGKHIRLEIGGVVIDASGLSDDALERLATRRIPPDADE
jgi:hypothetical protein